MIKYKLILALSITISIASCDIIITDDISDDPVKLIEPTDFSTQTSNPIMFRWDKVAGAEQYRMQITQGNFGESQSYILDTLISKNWVQYNLNTGNYQWRVQATNSEYQTHFSTFTVLFNNTGN